MSTKAFLSTKKCFLYPRNSSLHPNQCILKHAWIQPIDKLQLFTRQTSRSIEFWRRVLTIWASFKITQVTVHVQKSHRDPEWIRRKWDAQHEKAGNMMLDLCTSMKGFFVKAGQLIALQAFVPVIIRRKLSLLQDKMPPMSAEQTRQVIESELAKLGQTLDVFESIDLENVLGCASIAQVHWGRLKDRKTDVAVKVQYPDMEKIMISDLSNFRWLGEVLQKTELKFDLIRPVDELTRQISMEFDFQAEARGMTEIRYALRNIRSVTIPEVIPGLVTRKLLVMTYLNGLPMTSLETKLKKRNKRVIRHIGRKILRNLTHCYGKMILTDGFFQADCHPGNILVQNNDINIGLLDFGQTKRFTDKRRLEFARLVDAMARRDTALIADSLDGLGISIKPAKMEKTFSRKRPKGANSKLTLEEQLAYTMFDTATVPGVSDNPFADNSALRGGSVENLPRDLVFLLRTMQILKGICKSTFNSDYSIISSWGTVARAELRKSPFVGNKHSPPPWWWWIPFFE